MTSMIFVNLPVVNLARAKDFYTAIGFTNNPQFTDNTAACMVFSDSIHVMLLTHEKWRSFTQKTIPDGKKASEVMLAISRDSRQAVDAMTDAASQHGGKADINPKQDHGFMYTRSFEDPDGHIWEPMWMDMAAIPAQ